MQSLGNVKVPEGPHPAFLHMDGRIIEFSRECCQDLEESAGKGPELAQAYLRGLDGAVLKVRKAVVLQKIPPVSVKHGPPPRKEPGSISYPQMP
jgi:hypothetical protein